MNVDNKQKCSNIITFGRYINSLCKKYNIDDDIIKKKKYGYTYINCNKLKELLEK